MGRVVSLISMWKELSDNWIVEKNNAARNLNLGVFYQPPCFLLHIQLFIQMPLIHYCPLESWKGHFPAAVSMLHDIKTKVFQQFMWFTVKFYINSKIIINVLTLHRLKPVLRTTVSDFHTSQSVWERLQSLWGWRQVASHRAIESGAQILTVLHAQLSCCNNLFPNFKKMIQCFTSFTLV